MGLTRIAIQRPVFILMVFSAIIVMGLVAYTRLNAELYPRVNTPVVTIITTYSGASPEDVERLITKPLEDAVAGIADLDYLQSSSMEGISTIIVTFTDAANPDLAASDVERRVSAVRGQLPQDADQPSVLKVDLQSLPVLYLAMTGDTPLDRLYQLADDIVKPRLEAQNGVGQVDIQGGLQREIQVQFDPARLRAYGLTVDQVAQAIARENQGVPGGSIERGRQQMNYRLYGLFQSAAEMRELTVASTPSGVIRLGDVAKVVDTFKRQETRAFLNGKEAVAITVTKQSTANEIATVDAVRAEINRLNQVLPNGAHIAVISDTSVFTRNSLAGVQRALIEAVVLTGLVLLVFLHTLRSTLIVLIAIPSSLIGTFLAMNFLGFTLNIMTTMALVLVIGVLVDDSIVVLENIFRHLQLGETPFTAALKGRSEIGLAAIAISLVDVVVYTPVAFMSGISGQWFRSFGLVIVCAVLMSLFVAFTLTPMLASRWLQAGNPGEGRGPWAWFVRRFEGGLERLRRSYERALGWALAHRWVPPLVGLLSLILAFGLVRAGLVKFEFIPTSDNGQFTITVELPPGASLAATDAALAAVGQRLAAIPEVEYYLATSGVGGAAGSGMSGATQRNTRYGNIRVVLVDKHYRQRTLNDIIDQVVRDTRDIPGATVRVQVTSGGGAAQPVQVRVQGEDPRILTDLARRIEQIVRETPGTRDIANSGTEGNPETRLIPERRRMADLGVTAQQAATALRAAVDGTVVTKLRPEGEDEIDVRLIADEATRESLVDLGMVPLLNQRDGTLVYLGQVTRAEVVSGPTSIDRRNRQRVITIGANLATGVPLNDVTVPVQQRIRQLQAQGAIPQGYTVELGGQAEDQAKAFGNIFLALGLSIVLVYMLLAALYESLVLPFATMFALPMAVVGAFIALALTRNTLNLLSMIGVIVLMGLVGKNGILLVDYTNTLRQRGLPRREALQQAGTTRLRPILMTSAALVMGMMPLALGLEQGSEIYVAMAWVIIGGMLSSTLLSLLVVPCMYTYFDDLQSLIGRAWRALPLLPRWLVELIRRGGRRPVAPPRPVAGGSEGLGEARRPS
ncbi:MAG TPA: efflux RND transporter permease subunit [Chloroflexota bacterium]|nr:efflux RND transporter permease subunit [Chloroflexota bacterium]